jgi:hypothetical protein
METADRDDTAVPTTLKDSLMARLDRLGEAREVAQIAAVVGRQFPFVILEAVISRDSSAFEAALANLVAAGIFLPEVRGPERSFSFKHALLRDAAYESLLLARRREWHERIARTVEQRFPDLAANEPEVLAYHFGEAGLAGPACNYRMRAGDRAVSQSAYKEAIPHFSIGLKLAEALPLSADRMRSQLDFLVKLGPALMVARGMGSTDVEDACRRAAESTPFATTRPVVIFGSLRPPPNAERLPEDEARSVSATPVAVLVQECWKPSRARSREWRRLCFAATCSIQQFDGRDVKNVTGIGRCVRRDPFGISDSVETLVASV